MKKYDSYKDSGVEWIGEIPSHWNSSVFRRYCTLQQGLQIAREKRFDSYEEGRYKYLTVKYINKPLAENLEYIKSPSARVICKEDDVLLARTGATGEVVTGYEGVFHNNFFKINFDKQRIEKDYLVYYLKQNKIKDYLKLIAGTTTIPDLNHGDFLSTIFLVPPKREQEYIVKYLDKKTSEIDKLISFKEELIETLKKYRQSLITEVVTKGIDSNVKMKDSGVEWIGDIPEYWNVSLLKRYCNNITDGSHHSPETVSEGIPYITVKDVNNGFINFEECKYITEEDYLRLKKEGCQPNKGDVLLTKDGTIGRAVVVEKNEEFVVLSSLGIITPNLRYIIPKYLYYWLESDINVNQMNSYIQGSALKRLTISIINNLLVVLPTKEDQLKIIEYLDKKVYEINMSLKTIENQLDIMRSYRQSLIFEAITGKIDVRG